MLFKKDCFCLVETVSCPVIAYHQILVTRLLKGNKCYNSQEQ